jgi:hypothetical protein
MMPMRANMVGPPDSATNTRPSIAACYSAGSASPSAPALLFLIRWDRCGRWLRHGLRFRRGYSAPKLWPHAVTSPQLSALDPANEFAAHRIFRPDLQQRLVAGLWRRILGVCTCRKTNSGKNNERLHCNFPFAFHPTPRFRKDEQSL